MADGTETTTHATTETTAPADTGATTATGTTVANAGGTGTVLDPADKTETTAKFGDDWRTVMAGGDEKALKTLERFTDPATFFKSYDAMRAKMAAGEAKTALPKDATPEQVAAWRKANGIPEAPDKYELKLADGLVMGEADKPLVGEYLKVAHELNHSPEQVNANVSWYLQMQQKQEQLVAETNIKARDALDQKLREEWGGDYRANKNGVISLLDGAPQGVKDLVIGARDSEGVQILNRPEIFTWLAQLSREINPAATIVGPDGSASTPQGIEARIREIETVMRENRDKYNKDEAMQAELRKLYGARERLGGKQAA